MCKVFILLSANTCFISEEFDSLGNFLTRISDEQGQRVLPIRAQKIIDITLHLSGSDYRGATRASRFLLGKKKLPPIALQPEEEFVFLPLHCPTTKTTTYINFKSIYDVVSLSRRSSKIIFNNGTFIHAPYSARTIYYKVAEAQLLLRKMHYYPTISEKIDMDNNHI